MINTFSEPVAEKLMKNVRGARATNGNVVIDIIVNAICSAVIVDASRESVVENEPIRMTSHIYIFG